MLKKVNISLILLLLISLNGCKQNNENENNKTFIKNSTITQNRNHKNDDDKILQKIGISTEKDKIIIEPKKTKAFFDKLGKTFEQTAKRIKSKVDKIDEKDIGITANKDKITIDINKTTNFFNSFSKELEKAAKDIDKVVNNKE